MKQVLRQLMKNPGYTALAVVALALGIGANTVLFSTINTVFLRPLPYAEPERIVRVWSSFADQGLDQSPLSWPRFSVIRDGQDAFEEMAAQSFTALTMTGRGEPEQLQAARATDRLFATLGVTPLLGRTFSAADNAQGAENVVILSHGFWQRRFGANKEIIGQPLVLNGQPFTVIGVLPPTLTVPFDQTQAFITRPLEQEGLLRDQIDRGTGYLFTYARLKRGVTIEQAQAQVRALGQRYSLAHPERVDAKAGLSIVPLHEDLVGNQRPMFLTLLAAVGCVLLVACANVANLLLARFSARRKEIAIRTALGATRRRIVGAFLIESTLTAGIAGALGLLLALWGVDVLAAVGADFIPRASELALHGRVLAFSVGLTLLTGIGLGIVPAWHASRADASESLKDASRGSTAGRHVGRFRSTLLVGEVALSLLLLVCAALVIDSFRRLQKVEPGFRAADIATFNVALPPGHYTNERTAVFWQQLLERLRALPGVTHAAATASLPAAALGFSRSPVAVEGESLPPVHERVMPNRSTVTPGFFATLDIPVKQGRDFSWRDQPGSPAAVILNETLARRLFPNQNPIGRRVITGIQSIPREVVGVVGDVRSQNLAQLPTEEMYYAAAQVEGQFQTVVIRSTRPAGSLRPEIVAAVHAVDPGVPVAEVESYTEQLAGAIADRRLAMTLLGGFAGLALALAGMGIYSVIAYSVAQRTGEFGIRMALGAGPRQVITLVMNEGLKLALIGLGLGLVAAFAVTRLMQQMLFEVSATDPVIFIGVAAFLCAIAALACFIPARRATKVDPMTALRAD